MSYLHEVFSRIFGTKDTPSNLRPVVQDHDMQLKQAETGRVRKEPGYSCSTASPAGKKERDNRPERRPTTSGSSGRVKVESAYSGYAQSESVGYGVSLASDNYSSGSSCSRNSSSDSYSSSSDSGGSYSSCD